VSCELAIALDWGEEGPVVAWRRPIGEGYSAPIVWGQELILFYREADEEVVECADAETSATRWTFRYPTTYKCPVEYSSGPYSTPVLETPPQVVHPGFGPAGTVRRVYAWGAEGRLHCLDAQRGTLVWSRGLHDDYVVEPARFPVASSPLLMSDRVILNLGSQAAAAGILALDKNTGATIWTATQDGASHATPVAATVHGREYVFVWTAQHLTALDPQSGHVWFQIPYSAKDPGTLHATSPIVHGDVVLVSGYQLGCLAIRVLPDGGYQELWRGSPTVLDSHYNNLICQDGCVFGFGTYGGGLRCVDLATGQLRWTSKSRLRNAASIAVGDRLLLFDERGRLGAVRATAEGCESLAATRQGLLAGRCFSAPALSAGRLYLRNESELICLDLRLSSRSSWPREHAKNTR
jgi:outer membrane protein assembly factor BamB